MQVTVDGYVAGPEGQLDWMSFDMDMVGLPKVVFSKTLQHVAGTNVRVEGGDLADAVNQLKSRPGKDIIVYGGATFVSALIEHGLIDQMHLFVNPVAIGSGMRVFKGKTPLRLAASTAYPSGIVVNSYLPT
jgi:dihydrofolate reductase